FSFAQDYTAKFIGDYGNVTVMEVTGNYDANNPDGTINSTPREIIAKEFFKFHKDEYDFLVIFTNFDFKMPESDVKAFYLGIKNDTQGIGIPLFDNSALFGSNGKLQGIIDMGNISNLITDPLDPKFEETLYLLAHEMMHRWGAHVRFRDKAGNISSALLGRNGDHWSFLFNSEGSVLYGNKWQDNGNGTFTSIGVKKYYSSLDLYLMGFYDRFQVPPMLLIKNPEIDPAMLPELGATITGLPVYITIDDIIAVEGERIPGPSESQKIFKTAFLLITQPGTFTGYEIYEIENIRNSWITRYSILTDGQGLMQVASTPREDIPTNPGVILPPIEPRLLPSNIEDGVKWLMSKQGADGSWMDLTQTIDRDTAQAVLALKNFDIAQQNYSTGIQWLNGVYSGNMDYLVRRIETLFNSGEDITPLLNEILLRQNPDGGWGSDRTYGSNSLDTSLVLNALAVSGYSDQGIISKAIEYLKSKQNADGGWGSDDEGSTVEATANVVSAFNRYRNDYQLEEYISKGLMWLLQRQNPDGGFGNSPSTVYDTAIAVMTLRELDAPSEVTNNGLNYILSLQSNDGSWYESSYQTALAIQTVWKATVDPDLSIRTSDITFIPSTVKSLPSNIVINANIWNSGRTSVPQAKVVLYEGGISDANKIGEQVLAFPGQSFTTVTFSATITDGNEHRFYVSIDPDNLVKESNETNNTALNIIKPEPTWDFEILSSDIMVSQNPVDIFKDVRITSKITNKGTMNAYNVQVKYYIDEAGRPFEIATVTVDIPANSTITNETTWRTNKAGENLPITVFVDPFNSYPELSEDNNRAFIYLTVKGSTEPNLTVSYKDMTITPNPANERGSVNISAIIKNEGFSVANNITVNFYKGVPRVDGVLLGSQTIPSLNPGESSKVSIDWTDIMDSGERIIYVEVDPADQIKEISEDDNDTFDILKILSLPDLAVLTNSIVFSPPAPKDGDTVSIDVTVKNLGEQGVSNLLVNAYEGDTLIGTQVIPSISGNSQANISFTYNTAGKSGAHQITVIVDPDNAIIEQSEDNNTASRTLGVQDANLWLTEPYISPNGDGIKDSTQFFFRLDVPQTVKVIVVNEKGETVRTFSGAEFENITGGTITWDGLSDDGIVVDDGQYQIKVVDLNITIIGSLLVVVDNNRSPLTDAIGTGYLLNNNLTCLFPEISRDSWAWLAGDSSIASSVDMSHSGAVSGIYIITTDGKDIRRLTP
ncbi:MAG: CARDB domain-containing protein, partial [Candidatus Aenigmatarchaeota archaeon]